MKSLVIGGLVASLLTATPTHGNTRCDADDPDGSKVAAARATADQQCTDQGAGCANAPNHGTYVACVSHVANALTKSVPPGLPRTCKRAVKICAARSSCGKPAFVACSLTDEKGMTRCSVKPTLACTDRPGRTACANSGSCCDPCTP